MTTRPQQDHPAGGASTCICLFSSWRGREGRGTLAAILCHVPLRHVSLLPIRVRSGVLHDRGLVVANAVHAVPNVLDRLAKRVSQLGQLVGAVDQQQRKQGCHDEVVWIHVFLPF